MRLQKWNPETRERTLTTGGLTHLLGGPGTVQSIVGRVRKAHVPYLLAEVGRAARAQGHKITTVALRAEDERQRAIYMTRLQLRDAAYLYPVPAPGRTKDYVRILEHRKIGLAAAEIAKRDLPTPTGWDGGSVTDSTCDDLMNRRWVVHSSYYHKYTKSEGWVIRGSFLAGYDDGHPFAVRIPGTIKTVAEAITWLTPAAVRNATGKGLGVLRQGDIYVVETVRKTDVSELAGTQHTFHVTPSRGIRRISHPEHGTATIPKPWKNFKVYRQRQMSTNGTRAYAD